MTQRDASPSPSSTAGAFGATSATVAVRGSTALEWVTVAATTVAGLLATVSGATVALASRTGSAGVATGSAVDAVTDSGSTATTGSVAWKRARRAARSVASVSAEATKTLRASTRVRVSSSMVAGSATEARRVRSSSVAMRARSARPSAENCRRSSGMEKGMANHPKSSIVLVHDFGRLIAHHLVNKVSQGTEKICHNDLQT